MRVPSRVLSRTRATSTWTAARNERRFRNNLLVVGSALLWLLLGCATADPESDGRHIPSVPAIDKPKNVSGVDPCTLLENEQRSRLGVTNGSPLKGDIGPGCSWHGVGTLAITLTVSIDAGLEVLAADSDPAATRVRLNGYPALETFTADGAYCRYDVGSAPGQALVATLTGSGGNSCRALQPIVAGMMDRLGPQQ